MTVQIGGRNVLTTVREFRLLEYLATHRGRVLTRGFDFWTRFGRKHRLLPVV